MATKFAACLLVFVLAGVGAAKVSIVNNCSYELWPAAIPGGGVHLHPGQSWNLDIPSALPLATRFWARTGCKFDNSGRGRCVTGDCGNLEYCQYPGAPPTSLAVITFGTPGISDSFDYLGISLIDGFNVPMSIVPTTNQNQCQPGGRGPSCAADINSACPNELKVPQGCDSACTRFEQDVYCCRGQYFDNCQPSNYTEFFKKQCPDAYSYAKDDQTTFTCPAGTNYNIVFCPENCAVCIRSENVSHVNFLIFFLLILILILCLLLILIFKFNRKFSDIFLVIPT